MIGRFLQVDPASQYWSPYVGMGNSPIINADPSGGVANPVVGSDGVFRGFDEFGAGGEVIVYDGAFTDGMSQAAILDGGGLFANDFYIANDFTRGDVIDFEAIANYTYDQYLDHTALIASGEAIQTVLEVLSFTSGGGGGSGSPATRLAARGANLGKNSVYTSQTAKGVTQYVGITNNLARRGAQHLATKGINIKPLLQNLSRTDARAVEQALIEIHGLGKNGGTLLNKINSISPKHSNYADLLRRGHDLLKTVGY